MENRGTALSRSVAVNETSGPETPEADGDDCFPPGGVLPLAAEELVFETDVRPIFKEACFHCHGEGGEREGELDLRLVRLMKGGGESGPALVPGAPAKSLRWSAFGRWVQRDRGEVKAWDLRVFTDDEIRGIQEQSCRS